MDPDTIEVAVNPSGIFIADYILLLYPGLLSKINKSGNNPSQFYTETIEKIFY